MSARSIVGLLLALQNAATDAQAEALIRQLADPWTRAEARREWQRTHADQVTTWRVT